MLLNRGYGYLPFSDFGILDKPAYKIFLFECFSERPSLRVLKTKSFYTCFNPNNAPLSTYEIKNIGTKFHNAWGPKTGRKYGQSRKDKPIWYNVRL